MLQFFFISLGISLSVVAVNVRSCYRCTTCNIMYILGHSLEYIIERTMDNRRTPACNAIGDLTDALFVTTTAMRRNSLSLGSPNP